MKVMDLDSIFNYLDKPSYRFNSRLAVLLEVNDKWEDALLQWLFVMQIAKHYENIVWAFQRALYCRKRYINLGGRPGLSESDIFQKLQSTLESK